MQQYTDYISSRTRSHTFGPHPFRAWNRRDYRPTTLDLTSGSIYEEISITSEEEIPIVYATLKAQESYNFEDNSLDDDFTRAVAQARSTSQIDLEASTIEEPDTPDYYSGTTEELSDSMEI